jgi:hypothetical protein
VIDARFGHVNVVARDWRALAASTYVKGPEGNLVELQSWS